MRRIEAIKAATLRLETEAASLVLIIILQPFGAALIDCCVSINASLDSLIAKKSLLMN
jgi:hypothetical protein